MIIDNFIIRKLKNIGVCYIINTTTSDYTSIITPRHHQLLFEMEQCEMEQMKQKIQEVETILHQETHTVRMIQNRLALNIKEDNRTKEDRIKLQVEIAKQDELLINLEKKIIKFRGSIGLE